MPVMLNLSNGRLLPASELEALRIVARSNQSDVLLVGGRSFQLHHVSFMDGFSVDPIPGSFLERIGERRHRQLADSLERQLNGGSSFCRHSVCIWSKLAQLHLCRKVSEMKFRTELTLLHFLLILVNFPAVSSI